MCHIVSDGRASDYMDAVSVSSVPTRVWSSLTIRGGNLAQLCRIIRYSAHDLSILLCRLTAIDSWFVPTHLPGPRNLPDKSHIQSSFHLPHGNVSGQVLSKQGSSGRQGYFLWRHYVWRPLKPNTEQPVTPWRRIAIPALRDPPSSFCNVLISTAAS